MPLRAGLYFHIPFCVSKCHYCSFNSIPFKTEIASGYVDALRREIGDCGLDVGPVSVYIGGGTPTVLPQGDLLHLLGVIKNKFKVPEDTETTIEANPGTLGGIDLAGLREAGVNRVSLGVQSFDPGELRILGRIHGEKEVVEAVGKLKDAGLGNIGIDLIYSLPGQDMEGWKRSLDRAVSLDTRHVSLYDLSLEEGTRLYGEVRAGRLAMPPEPLQEEMYLAAVERLEAAGFVRYEISNFARAGYECRHNINYWSGGDYLGFGAGAYSTISYKRYKNIPDVRGYIDAAGAGLSPAIEAETLTQVEKEREYIMLALRMAGGLDFERFRERFGRDRTGPARGKIARLEEAGYIEAGEGRIRLTLKGVLASNSVITEFF